MNEAVPVKTTLIVVPATLLDQWLEEFMIHVEQKALCVCVPTLRNPILASVSLHFPPTFPSTQDASGWIQHPRD